MRVPCGPSFQVANVELAPGEARFGSPDLCIALQIFFEVPAIMELRLELVIQEPSLALNNSDSAESLGPFGPVICRMWIRRVGDAEAHEPKTNHFRDFASSRARSPFRDRESRPS